MRALFYSFFDSWTSMIRTSVLVFFGPFCTILYKIALFAQCKVRHITIKSVLLASATHKRYQWKGRKVFNTKKHFCLLNIKFSYAKMAQYEILYLTKNFQRKSIRLFSVPVLHLNRLSFCLRSRIHKLPSFLHPREPNKIRQFTWFAR